MSPPLDRSPIPKAPLWVSAAGAVPFVALAGALWASPVEYAPALMTWLSAYAAVVLTFTGAVHWGAAMVYPNMKDHEQAVYITWSAVPAAAAWASLLMPMKTGLILLIATYVVQFAADRQFSQRFALPSWYLRLRAGLTPIAVICLLLALMQLGRG
jgi:hypothetical protein